MVWPALALWLGCPQRKKTGTETVTAWSSTEWGVGTGMVTWLESSLVLEGGIPAFCGFLCPWGPFIPDLSSSKETR